MAWMREALPKDRQDGATPFAPRTNKDLVEEELFARRRDLFSDLDIVFFDTTSIYFEGEGGETIGQRGHSKDHRPELQLAARIRPHCQFVFLRSRVCCAPFSFTPRLRLAFHCGYRHRFRLAPFQQVLPTAGHTGEGILACLIRAQRGLSVVVLNSERAAAGRR